MSLVDTPPAPVESTKTASAPAAVRAKAKPAVEARRRVFAIALGALAAATIFALVFLAFEGPVAQSWYSTRQHQLASKLVALGAHHGPGAPVALLQIPRLGTNLVVAEGDTPQQLRSGPGHRIGSPLPGDVGNSVIVGHRAGWGGPFRALGTLKRGDLVVVQTATANGLPRNAVFKVTGTRRVGANDVVPFAASTDRRLTIVTGTGGAYSDARLVITAVSGPEGKVRAPIAGLRATTSSGSSVWNADLLLALVGIGGAVLLWFTLRRRYHVAAVAAVVVPIALVGLLGLLLNLDASLPPAAMSLSISRSLGRGLLATAIAIAALLAFVSVAAAATSVTEPTGNPVRVALDAAGKPVPFTVAASGFPFRTPVFVEQCNGRPPSAPNWSPTIDCDIASSQAPVNADAKGVARFPASDPALVLKAFSGASPQGLFNCLAPGAPSPKNGLPDFENCQLRVASNPTHATDDQVFVPIVLGASATPSSPSSGSSSNPALWVGLAALVIVIAAAVGVWIWRRPRPASR